MDVNCEKVFRKYIGLHGDDEELSVMDSRAFGMGERLKLARKVEEDGNKIVADLGSHFGGMSHALKEYGVRTVSTDIAKRKCKRIKGNDINEEVVQCDSFRLPLRGIDALVSYMFLGMYIRPLLRDGRSSLSGIFDALLRSADAVYSVELKSEYTEWLNGNNEYFNKLFYSDYGSNLIEQKLRKALPELEVEYLGEFGDYAESGRASGRTGFKFTKKKKTGGLKAKILGWIKA